MFATWRATGDGCELVTRLTGLVQGVGLQGDFHEGGKEARAAERVPRLGKGPTEGRFGALRLSLGEPKQGQTGLRLEPHTARLPVRLLGRGILADEAFDFSLQIARVSARPRSRDVDSGVEPSEGCGVDSGATCSIAVGGAHVQGAATSRRRRRGSISTSDIVDL